MSGATDPLLDVADADLQAARETLDDLDLTPFDPSQPRGFEGLDEAAKSLMRPAAGAARSVLMLAPATLRVMGTGLTQEGEDWYFENVVDRIGTNAVEHWTPDPAAMGATAKALSTVGTVVGSVPQAVGTPSLFLASSAVDPATDLVRQGVDADTALAVGGVNMAVNAAGMRIPAAFGSTLATRIATGAAANTATGAVGDVASQEVLEAGGYEEQARGYDVTDPYARSLDLLMGAAFGVKAHVDAPALGRPERDAVLVASNADHYQRATLPGAPAAAGADLRHQAAMDEAIARVLGGERVDVGTLIRAEDFTLRPELQPRPAGGDGYGRMLVALESAGRPNAKAATSSATGLHQFTDATWLSTVDKARPAWAEGLDKPALLAARTDPAKSTQMEAVLRAENAQRLARAGQEATGFNLYAMHHFGGRGLTFAKVAGDTPMAEILTAKQLKANKYLQGLTKDQAIANWTDRARRAGVEVSGAAMAVTPPAPRMDGAEAGRIIDEHLARLDELSTTRTLPREEAAALAREDEQLRDRLRDHERRVSESILPADPRDRLGPVELETITARRVEIRQALEHSRTAAGYAQRATRLRERLERTDRDADLIQLAETLREGEPAGAPRLAEGGTPQPLQVGERPAGQPDAGIAAGGRTSQIDAPAYTRAHGQLDVPTAERRGAPSEAIAGAGGNRHLDADAPGSQDVQGEGGRTGASDRGQPQPQRDGRAPGAPGAAASGTPRFQDGSGVASDAAARNPEAGAREQAGLAGTPLDPLVAARDIALAMPELRIPTGEVDASGNPITATTSELLARLEGELENARIQASAVEAAAACFLRVGQ